MSLAFSALIVSYTFILQLQISSIIVSVQSISCVFSAARSALYWQLAQHCRVQSSPTSTVVDSQPTRFETREGAPGALPTQTYTKTPAAWRAPGGHTQASSTRSALLSLLFTRPVCLPPSTVYSLRLAPQRDLFNNCVGLDRRD